MNYCKKIIAKFILVVIAIFLLSFSVNIKTFAAPESPASGNFLEMPKEATQYASYAVGMNTQNNSVQGFSITDIGLDQERVWFSSDVRRGENPGKAVIISYLKGTTNRADWKYYQMFDKAGHGQILDVFAEGGNYHIICGSRASELESYSGGGSYRHYSRGIYLFSTTGNTINTEPQNAIDLGEKGIKIEDTDVTVASLDKNNNKLVYMAGNTVYLQNVTVDMTNNLISLQGDAKKYSLSEQFTHHDDSHPLQSCVLYSNYLYVLTGRSSGNYVTCFDLSGENVEKKWECDISALGVKNEPESIKVYTSNGITSLFVCDVSGTIYALTGKEILNNSQNEDKEVDEDNGGILLEVMVFVISSLADAMQSFTTWCMTGVWRWIMVAEDIASNVNNTKAYEGEFENLSIWASDNKSDIDGWPEDIELVDNREIYNSDDGLVRNENEDKNEQALSGNEYFLDVTGYNSGYKYPQIAYSPEEIFSGAVRLLDVNFLSRENDDNAHLTIQAIVRRWFIVLRYIALAVMLSVLIYIGIKVMISSTANDKSKYKEGILNWVQGLLIIFLLPYVMSFVLDINEELLNLFSNNSDNSITVYAYDAYAGETHTGKLTYTKFKTNLMGLVRFQIGSRNPLKKVSFAVIYLMLVIFTVKFTFTYLRRVIYMAFLTLLSPIIAVMYPINAIKDGGKPQDFSIWVKEYTFNVLLQVVQMLLYFILVSCAVNLASGGAFSNKIGILEVPVKGSLNITIATNPIYIIGVLCFISYAEKILKKIFGLDSASLGTVGGMDDAAASVVTYNNMLHTIRNVKSIATKFHKNNRSDSINKKEDALSEPDYETDFNAFESNNIQNQQQPEEDDEDEFIDVIFDDDVEEEKNRSKEEIQKEIDEVEEKMEEEGTPYGEWQLNDRWRELQEELENAKDEADEAEETKDEEELEGEQEEAVKPQAFKPSEQRVLSNREVLGMMIKKRGQLWVEGKKHEIDGMTPKKVIKGAAKGAYTAAKVYTLGKFALGMVLTEAALSAASNGRYSSVEAVGTFAGAAVGANKLIFENAEKKVAKYMDEFEEIKTDGKVDSKSRKADKAEKDFWKNKNNLRKYQQLYGNMSSGKLNYELKRATELAREGYGNVEEQLKISAFADYLTEERFNAEYSSKMFESEEARRQAIIDKAAEIRAKGSSNLQAMTDEDVVKVDIMKKAEYQKLAINTYKAQKSIPSQVRYGDKDTQEEFIKNYAENEVQAQGLRKAIELTHLMNSTQAERKERLERQKEEYKEFKKKRNKKNKEH